MPGAARLGDILGPGGVLVSPVSPNVFVNGRPIALNGTRYTAHPCCGARKCPPTHCGGPTYDYFDRVLVNGKPPLRKGTATGVCGHNVRTSSLNVIIGRV